MKKYVLAFVLALSLLGCALPYGDSRNALIPTEAPPGVQGIFGVSPNAPHK